MDENADSTSSFGSPGAESSVPSKRKRRETAGTLPDDADRERHACPQAGCNKSFGRIEHMKRHAASHSIDRPFKCPVCEKGFYRLDTMQRHELIHRDETENAKPKGARACTECAVAKVRCSGGTPCTRCASKDADCRYPDTRVRHDEPLSPTDTIANGIDHESNISAHLPSTAVGLPVPRATTASTFALSPPTWDQSAASPAQWFPSNTSLDFPMRSDAFPEQPPSQRHASFSASSIPPVGLTSYSDLRQGGFVTAPQATPPVNTSGTRHWLETLLEPQASERGPETPGTAVSQKTTSVSETYLDGDGARLPKIGIHRRFNSRPSLPLPVPGVNPLKSLETPSYSFPLRFCHANNENGLADRRIIDDYTYNQLRRHYDRLCGPQSVHMPAFDSLSFISWDYTHTFIYMYLDEFQPLVPIYHLPTLDLCGSHWLVTLAIIAMGCHFADSPDAEVCALGLNEFLRRAIIDVNETIEKDLDPMQMAQVKLLSAIGMIYCGDERMERHGWRQHSDVVKFCRTHWLQEDDPYMQFIDGVEQTVEQQWRRWKDVEGRRRTGYAIWYLDCIWAYEYQERSLLTVTDAKVALPCQEVLWEAESALQWQHVRGYSVAMPSLNAATNSIYIEKRVEPTMGEFSRILVIHALYNRSWEVQTHLSNPISHWVPTAVRQSLKNIPVFNEPIWLPGDPSYFRFRNATCDCLDILHWRANSVTGAASGIEHPTLLHLHIARIVLLTPFRNICDLAYGLTKQHINSTANSADADLVRNREIVRRWAEDDQCKARLAMYHAGVLFWHVRLYSAKGFYEPPAVMLAALALWAFGTFTTKDIMATSPNGGNLMFIESADDEASYPTSINIDRPADDEIVQMYIRRGDRMQAMIAGVGDIRSPLGPYRVLVEGAKLTSSLANWGCSRRVIKLLTTLAHVSQQGILT